MEFQGFHRTVRAVWRFPFLLMSAFDFQSQFDICNQHVAQHGQHMG